MGLRRPSKNKNPPIFSHEFVIQNHADIISCVAMVFVIGLMFQATSPIASMFVGLQHNITESGNETDSTEVVNYTYGLKDFCTAFFYFLICIVIHAVVQEYVLDKLNRRMHLSKVKHSKFNESGQLLVLYAISAGWGIDIIVRENYVAPISSLWQGYPHALLPFFVKFYFIMQLCYWVHTFPELYFQKVKKDELAARIEYGALYLVFIAAAYLLNFTRVALCLLVVHYGVEMIFHFSRLLYFADKVEGANIGFMVWNVLFVLARLVTITLTVLTFWFGLAQTSENTFDLEEGNFNTQIVRVNCLAALCLLQAYMMWNFITFHLRRLRERRALAQTNDKKASRESIKRKEKKPKAAKKEEEEDSSVVDSTTENGTVRQRTPKAKRT